MKFIITLIVALALGLPASALATSSATCDAYNPQTCALENEHIPTSATSSAQVSQAGASSLPFTGLDVVLLVAGGTMFLGMGIVVRRLAHYQD